MRNRYQRPTLRLSTRILAVLETTYGDALPPSSWQTRGRDSHLNRIKVLLIVSTPTDLCRPAILARLHQQRSRRGRAVQNGARASHRPLVIPALIACILDHALLVAD